jgi:hypothetical protein
MRRADLPGVRPDAAAAVFLPDTKFNAAAPLVKAFAPSKGRYNFQMPALGNQLALNQHAAY